LELSLAARGDERAPVAALAGSEAAARTNKPRRLSIASMDRFNPLSFRPSAEPGSRYRLLTAGCHGCPNGPRPRPDDPLPLVSSRSLRHDMAEATDKSKQEEHTAAANLSETPEKQKNIYMTISLS
jgi:hypothetical protein